MQFKKDTDGNTVFSPNGIFGSAYLINDADRLNEIRRIISSSIKLLFLLNAASILFVILSIEQVIDIPFVGVWLITMGLCLIYFLYYAIKIRTLIEGFPTSSKGITVREIHANQAGWFKTGALCAFLIFSLVATIKEIITFNYAQSMNESIMAIFLTIIFSGTSIYCIAMLRIKKKSEKAS